MRLTKFQKAVYWSRKITPILNKNAEEHNNSQFRELFARTKYTYLYNFLAMLN